MPCGYGWGASPEPGLWAFDLSGAVSSLGRRVTGSTVSASCPAKWWKRWLWPPITYGCAGAPCARLVVDARPDATDHLEIGAGAQGLWGHNMRRADDQNVATGQPAKKLVLVPPRTGDDLDTFATEQLQALEGDDSLVLAHSTAPTGK